MGKKLYCVLMERAEDQLGQWKKKESELFCLVKIVHQCSPYFINSELCVEVSYLVRILPPFFPFVGVAGSNGQITNRGVKPHIEYLQRQQDSWVLMKFFAFIIFPAGNFSLFICPELYYASFLLFFSIFSLKQILTDSRVYAFFFFFFYYVRQ